MIGCGDSAGAPTPDKVQMWNLENNMVMQMSDARYTCPSGQTTMAENGDHLRYTFLSNEKFSTFEAFLFLI